MLLELPQELTIARAAELAALLRGALDAHPSLELAAGAVAEVDVVGLQLLVAARRSARARGLAFGLTSRSAALSRAAQAAGLGAGEDERWLVEEGTCPSGS